jgi:hypothetical protein
MRRLSERERANNIAIACLKMRLVLAKSWICSRTTSMPRSSDALSSSVIARDEAPYSERASARIVVVLPVPGGP